MKKLWLTIAAIAAALIIAYIPAEVTSAATTTTDATADTDSDGALGTNGYYTTDNGFYYNIVGGKAVIRGRYAREAAMTMPLTITVGSQTYDVDKIADGAFEGDAGLETVIINNAQATSGTGTGTGTGTGSGTSTGAKKYGITTIGDGAFANCQSLKSIQIAATVTSIGAGCFEDCPSLESITVDGGNPSYRTSDGVLYEFVKDKTKDSYGTWTLVRYPAGNTNNVYTCPASLYGRVKTIGKGAFSGAMNLTDISLPESVSTIEDAAFQNCQSLTTINIPDKVTAIPNYCFESCISLVKPQITDNIVTIGVAAFRDCTSLGITTLPKNLVRIDNYAFYNCYSLDNIELPGGMTSIGAYSFEKCTGLRKIVIPGTVSYIGTQAFKEDKSLAIYCHGKTTAAKYANDNAITSFYTFTVRFYSQKNELLKTQEVLENHAAEAPEMEKLDGFTLKWSCKFDRIIDDTDVYAQYEEYYTVEFIDDFKGRSVTKKVSPRQAATPPSWTVEGYQLSWKTYKGDTSYKYITTNSVFKAVWTDPVTGYVIGDGVKAPATKGKELLAPDAIYKVMSSDIQNPTVTYMECNDPAAVEVEIPDTVTIDSITYKVVGVGARAFINNPYIEKVTIGKNVTKIRASAFQDCSNLATIVIRSKKLTSIKKNAFTGIATKSKFKVYLSKKDTYKRLIKNSGTKSFFTMYSISGE